MNKEHFPIFKNYTEKKLIYLDSASTTQKPKILSQAITHFYENYNSNIGRSAYNLAYIADQAYEKSRKNIANFIGADPETITFTLGATHSLNLVAYTLSQKIKKGSKIILSILEHHANILPWQFLAKSMQLELVYIEDFYQLANPNTIDDSLFENVSVIALPHVTNTTGQIIPIEKWIKLAKEKNIYTVIDGSQAICSFPLNLMQLNPDFYIFSAHKLYGPMGLGILMIKKSLIRNLQPLLLGGGIIEDVTKNNFVLVEDIRKFEAGTPNIANVYAFSEVLTWLNDNDWETELKKLKYLNNKLKENLSDFNFIIPIISNSDLDFTHIYSFNIKNVHAHDVGTYLDQKGICVRVGKHCAYPLHEYLDLNSSIRVSWGIYNDEDDLLHIVNEIENCSVFFK